LSTSYLVAVNYLSKVYIRLEKKKTYQGLETCHWTLEPLSLLSGSMVIVVIVGRVVVREDKLSTVIIIVPIVYGPTLEPLSLSSGSMVIVVIAGRVIVREDMLLTVIIIVAIVYGPTHCGNCLTHAMQCGGPHPQVFICIDSDL
jgi:hypothetical protein